MTTTTPPFLRGIFELARDNPFNTPNTTEMDDASFYASLASKSGHGNFDYLGRNNDTGSGNWAVRPGSFLEQLNQKYGGSATFDSRPGGGDSGGGSKYSLNIDYDKLPKTKFGSARDVTPYHEGMKLYNKALVYDDPNYGKITLSQNVDPGIGKYIGPGLMAIASMGMGSLMAPGMAAIGLPGVNPASAIQSLGNVAGGALDGKGFNPMTLASLALGATGAVPGLEGIGQVAKTGMSAYKLAQMVRMLSQMSKMNRTRSGG